MSEPNANIVVDNLNILVVIIGEYFSYIMRNNLNCYKKQISILVLYTVYKYILTDFQREKVSCFPAKILKRVFLR